MKTPDELETLALVVALLEADPDEEAPLELVERVLAVEARRLDEPAASE